MLEIPIAGYASSSSIHRAPTPAFWSANHRRSNWISTIELDLGVGAAFPAFAIMQRQVWLLTEFNYTRYIGHGVPVERLVHPAELRLGLQLNFPWYKTVALGWRFSCC